ncbi:MAG TPA: helix-turn-helix domain-containing protein [Actinomycetes bacterium]|nr:helix-turn-helix domain-containing protein [Actinomycetes bacterium]
MAAVKRSYDASGRRAQAQARRRAVVVAARALFERDGFRLTTITAVAERAGVSAESIYKGFGTKAALAKAVFDFVIAGDDEPLPVWRRAEADAVRAEPDVRRKILLYTGGLAERQQRSAKVQILIRDGGHTDETLVAVWQQLLEERLTGMTMLGRHLLGSGQLREGIELDEVRDVLWTYTAVELYELLVLARGWSLDRYADWIGEAITAALIASPPPKIPPS